MNSKTRYRITLSYVGTRFCGWQKQPNRKVVSIQGCLETALKSITTQKVAVAGSGRTDAGVHALAQVAHFDLAPHRKGGQWETRVLQNGLNSKLPADIRILNCEISNHDFHAQKTAIQKQYAFYFAQGPSPLPFLEPYTWWIRDRLDDQAMNEAVKKIEGEHDFKVFQASGALLKTTVRKIVSASVERVSPVGFLTLPLEDHGVELVRLRLVGTGFLKQMVRSIAGTLLQVGDGRRDPNCLLELIQSKKRHEVGPTAPSKGLWLERVDYDN